VFQSSVYSAAALLWSVNLNLMDTLLWERSCEWL